jgi:hypothetical protein
MTELDGPHARVLAVLREDAAAGGIDLIRRVCRTCVRLLPVDGAAVTVVAHVGQRELVYATDTVSTALADLQFALGEGPSFEAYTGGNPVLVPDLGAAFPSAGRSSPSRPRHSQSRRCSPSRSTSDRFPSRPLTPTARPPAR